MAAQIIDGKKIAAELNEENRKEISMLARDYNLQPGLAVVLVGDDPGSQVYVNMKDRKCQELG
ncbi:MAG: tetrahydrofolate dehydrogenase/cyclohydrolase catalytic domain-containing protein, partial [Victivallaceae bacterium]|nr:tetrahydrofolate dehydrogenase/cyclohydrolase catalytic domain-containing protein [Victivallaceae bacterium]